MDLSVLICSFGDDRWEELAWSRAYPSTLGQDCEVHVVHDRQATVSEVRNRAVAEFATGEWVVFLDADDELHPGFVAAVEAEERSRSHWPKVGMFTPQVEYVKNRRRQAPRFWPAQDLCEGNWMVIGTVVPRQLFNQVGGFKEWPIYEDWCLWQRMWRAGGVPVECPGAVYIAHWGPNSRNRSLSHAEKLATHAAIRQANGCL